MRFAAIGLNHLHIFQQVDTLRRAGGEIAAFHAREDDLAALFGKAFASAKRVSDPREILEDDSIELVASAAIPDERARLGVEVMRHGKDFFVDKPGAVTLEQLEELRRVQRETGRLCAIYFSERLENPATERAIALAREGAVGRPLHVIGLGPHRLGLAARPPWFYERARTGGILADLASHQTDQFLLLTGAAEVEIASAHVANFCRPEHPELEDFGELLLRGESATGYARVDWLTPDGLESWGDVRLLVLGSEGTLEVRKNLDLAGREGGNHLFLVDAKGTHYLDCRDAPLPFGPALLRDVRERTQTALPQEHCFRAMELALRAQAGATRLAAAGI